MVDLNLRNNLAPEVVRAVLNKQLSLVADCEKCPHSGCAGVENARRLRHPVVQERLDAILDAVAQAGVHATMRDLQGFVSFLLFGGGDCAKGTTTQPFAAPYWINAFEGGVGPVFDALRRLDPRDHTAPFLDDALWRRADTDGHWLVPTAGYPRRVETDFVDRRDEFISEKRRALLEHERGGEILSNAGSVELRLLRELLEGRRGAREVIGLLNRFFDPAERRADLLHLWTSHRYDARPTRLAASSTSMAASLFEVLVPTLRPDLAAAFGALHPDHVMLTAKGRPPREALRVDVPLLEALLAAERGLPSTFRRGEPEARIAAFFDRLARLAGGDDASSIAEVRFVDMNTGQSIHVGVDISARRYTAPR